MVWPLYIVVVAVVHPALCGDILPKITSPEPYKTVYIKGITSQDIQDAFVYGEQKGQERTNLENKLAKNGRLVDKQQISAEARSQRFNAISPKTMLIEANQKTFEEASNYLADKYQLTTDQRIYGLRNVPLPNYSSKAQQTVSKCQDLFKVQNCDARSKYRTPDGSCNNLNNPRWGMSFTCFARLLGPAYADGLGYPRVAVDGGPLPNPRVVSTLVHTDVNVPSQQYTLMTMQWGQFMDHDMTLTPMTRSGGTNMDMIECCPIDQNNQHPACFPIQIPPGDNFYAPRRQSCLNFVRSAACDADCTLGPRQQTNQLTACIDASNVYGSEKNGSDGLRQFRNGLLQSQYSNTAGYLLPPSVDPVNDQCSRQEGTGNCFRAGDERVNEQPGLTCMHTIWIRQHNRIVSALKDQYPGASDEDLYQYGRKIVGAQLQRITYGEFLPVLLGPALMKQFDLGLRGVGSFTTYDPDTEPSILHEFATAAYRVGHTLIQNIFPLINQNGQQYSSRNLSDNFFFTQGVQNGELTDIIRGIFLSPAQNFDRHVVAGVTNNLYRDRRTAFGMDLVALNLQRGRDHGIHGYVDYVNYCFKRQIRDFSDLVDFMPVENIKRLQNVYANVYDVDLFSAGILENPLQGAVVGPTFGCIIAVQFYHLKYGDRFFFEHRTSTDGTTFPNFFTTAQINQIRQTPLSRVLCWNAGIDTISENVFLPGSPLRNCQDLPDLDLGYF